ncbi:MAG TPA: hypothetical protein VK327_06325, partial [Candidatus Paceibacterota bacterium]|nr:hypothetical protein [Candidatus Paceibacterota bacterium]
VDFLGVSVGASGTITISGSAVTMSISIYVVVIPAINIDTPAVKVWGVTIFPAIHIHTPAVVVSGTWSVTLGQTQPAPPPPPVPVLATPSGNNLILNLGADAVNRGSAFPSQSVEEYVIANVVGNPGSSTGQTVDVSALGYTQRYFNVTNIIVHDTSTSDTTIQIADGVTATADITLGSGNNAITTGGGFATIRDKGTGINTITGGAGGGVYIGGLNASNAPYATKGLTTINNGTGNFAVQYSGYANYTLTQTLLQAGTYLIYLNGVSSVSLTATTTTGANVFNIFGWYGSGSIIGNGADNTINVNPQTGLNTVLVLTDTALQTTIGINPARTMTLSGIQTANLTGGSSANTYTVSGWTGTGSITGPTGSTNTLLAVSNANFTLTNSLLTRSGFGDLQLANIINAVLTGGAGANSFTVNGTTWTGHATLNGVAGNDTYNLTLTGAGTTWFTIADPTSNSADVLNVTTSFTPTVTGTQLTIGPQKVDYSGVAVLNLNGTVAGLIYNVRSTNSTTTTNLITFGVNNVINVSSTAGQTQVTTANVNSILGALTITGNGSDTLNVSDIGSSTAKTGSLTATSLTGLGTGGITYSGVSVLNISLGSGSDTINVISTNASTVTTVNLGLGDDTANVGNVLDVIAGKLIIDGQSGLNTLNIDDTGSATGKTGSLTSTTFTGFGMGTDGITFASFAVLNLSLGSGNDVLDILSTNATTLTTVNTGTGSNTINLASTGNVLTGIAGKLIVNGQGSSDTLNVDDSGDPVSATLNLTSTTLTGLGMAAGDATKGIEFHGLETLNIILGAKNNSLYLKGSPAGATTNIITGSGTNTIAVGSSAEAVPGALVNGEAPNTGSTLDDVLGTINLTGSGSDTLNIDDTGRTAAKTGTLTATTLNGLSLGGGGITFTGLSALTLSLGSGGDTLAIVSTAAVPFTINGDAGNDTFNVQATTGALYINGGSGDDTFNLSSAAPATTGNVNAIAGLLTLDGGTGNDLLTVDDSSDTTANTGLLTATSLTGLGLGSGVNYDGFEALHIALGSGDDTFNIRSIAPTTPVTLTTGAGVDVVNVGSSAP